MKWVSRVRRWGLLGVAVATLGGGLIAGKHWAETHALAAVLGPDAHSSAVKVHWSRLAGCAENISIPLARPNSANFSTARLTADQLWFTYDLPALLRKRLVVPRVVIEDARIEARLAITKDSDGSLRPSEQSAEADARSAPLAWLAGLRGRIESLEHEQFTKGTQVSVDTAMLSEQWSADFSSLHDRAQRILQEARDIQQQLAALDNLLRHEPQVIASRDRLDLLRAMLVGMKSDLTKTDRTLRDQQSRIREALLIEKNSLHEQGLAFRAPPAQEVALRAIETWTAACLREPACYSTLLADMIHKPYVVPNRVRGTDVRYFQQPTADVAVMSAKIAGEISLGDKSSPFTASGSFQRMLDASVAAGDKNTENKNTENKIAEDAHWEMSVGGPSACVSLEGHSRDTQAGTSHVSLHSTACGQIQAECELSRAGIQGEGRLQLRQWLSENSTCDDLRGALGDDPLVSEFLRQALADLDHVPDVVEFRFSGPAIAPRLEISPAAASWLSDELTRLASDRVAQGFEAAAEKLESQIHRDLDALNRSIALAHSQALQHINQSIDELRIVQADVLNNLQHRAGTHFARISTPSSGTQQ